MTNKELKNIFAGALPATINADTEWQLIADKYSDSSRHYHTLKHLCDMGTELEQYYGSVIPTTTILALVYHDFEYNVLRSDNEKQSALYASRKLYLWGLPGSVIGQVKQMIESTQQHTTESNNTEVRVFLDADMAVLGSQPDVYNAYAKAVRKEFAIYPDFMYNKGRRDFLKRTLDNGNVFLTNYFNDKYGAQARINIQNELNSLL